MATRQYCDHCGNTIRNPHKYCYGPHPAVNYVATHLPNYAGYSQYPGVNAQSNMGTLGGTPTYSTVATAVPSPEMVVIDLCDHCVKIWMTRVENLTKASDVQSGQN